MYQFLDRSTLTLTPSQHFLLTAVRLWAVAATRRRCPAQAISQRFGEVGLGDQLQHFHLMMIALNREATWRLQLSSPCATTIDEDEASLLELFDTGCRDEAACQRIAGALVRDADTARIIARAASYVARCAAASATLGGAEI